MLDYKWNNFNQDIDEIAKKLSQIPDLEGIYGILRGGLVVAIALSHKLELPVILDKKKIRRNIAIVDDIVDTGQTMTKLLNYPDNFITASLWYNQNSSFQPLIYCNVKNKDEWVKFPWETTNSSKYDGTAN